MHPVVICIGKNEYHSQLDQKLSDPSASSETRWYIFEWLYNEKKLPIIPALRINNKLESDSKIKGNSVNSFFASKSTPLVNSSIAPNLPLCFNHQASLILFQWGSYTKFKAFNINKAHGCYDKSIRWSSYAVSLLLSPCQWFSTTSLILAHFQIS